jgi:hypothetical protein
MATVTSSRPKAVADAPRPNPALCAFALNVVQKMTNNPNFPNPGTVVTDLSAAASALGTAITNKGTTKAVANALTLARQNVLDKVGHAKDFVNASAEKAPADQAKAIIESAGFRIRKIVVRSTLPLEVKDGPLSGTAALVAHAVAKDAVYFFQVSTDQKNWTALPSVMKCRTTATGLTVGTTYYFRVQAQTRKGFDDWSAIVTFVVR